MAGLAFAFVATTRQRLEFHFAPAIPPWSGVATQRGTRYHIPDRPSPWSGVGTLRGGRYSRPDMPPPWSGVGTLRNPRFGQTGLPLPPAARWRNDRHLVPPVPFIGEIPPQNVRAQSISAPLSFIPSDAEPAPLLRSMLRDTQPLRAEGRLKLEPAAGLGEVLRYPYGQFLPALQAQRIVIEDSTTRSGDELRLPWSMGILGQSVAGDAWRDAQVLDHELRLDATKADQLQNEHRAPFGESQLLSGLLGMIEADVVASSRLFATRFPFDGAGVLAGFSWPWPAWPGLPPLLPRPPLRFHFHSPLRPRLQFRFGREPAWSIPIQDSYRMQHTFELVRLPDRAAIPVSSVTLNSAWDEWAWTFSANLIGPIAVNLLRPVVSEALNIEVRLDGYTWQFRLDQIAGSAEFGKTGGQTHGRGRAAMLGPDIALAANGYETEAKTARQLAEQELIGTNWQLDWPENFVDWIVPARRFSYTAKTPIDVIVKIVETAGGHVMADPALDILHIAPRYPIPVWEWTDAEPDIILPRSILKTLAWKPRIGLPYDAIYLGDGESVLAYVKRQGLPGVSLPDAPIIESLLCHLDVCRSRGITYLSDAAAGVDFTLTLPLSSSSEASPLRSVGELVRFEDGGKQWIGLITNININIEISTVIQALTVRAIEVT